MSQSSSHVAPEPPPAGMREAHVRLPWGPMHLLHGGQGPALLLLHGLGGTCLDFAYLAPLLARRHTLVIPDLMGHGASAKPDAPYSMDWHLQVLEALCAELGLKRFFLAGHSMGGQLALMLAARRPELVRRLALVCPAGGQRGRLAGLRLLDLLLTAGGERFLLPRGRLAALYVRRLTPYFRRPEVRVLTARLRNQWSGPQRRPLERALLRSARALLDQPAWPLAPGLGVPVLMVWGLRDQVVPADWTRNLWAHLPAGLRLGLSLDCGHLPVYTRYRLLDRAFSLFLKPAVD